MAVRPVFLASRIAGSYVLEMPVSFEWFPGMAKSQAQLSIDSLHQAVRERFNVDGILEISSKSRQDLGVRASAFNLPIRTVLAKREFSVESAYQASKVFERGGPFTDLLDRDSREAKKDARLTESGRLVAFEFYGQKWGLYPRRAFYDWLYLQALAKQPEISSELVKFDAFTDIAFNPERSINCQAHAAALYVSLYHKGLVEEVLDDRSMFLRAFTDEASSKGFIKDEHFQLK
jgi:hypothetical protein